MEDKKPDVDKDDSSASTHDHDDSVEDKSGDESDKEKNFAKLRTTNEDLVKANKILTEENEELAGKRSLGDDDGDGDADDDKDGKSKKSTTEEVLFNRDLKEATRIWNKENKVSPEIWEQVKAKINFTGEETQSEIVDKINETYTNIPEVRKKLDADLISKGKNEAMNNFQDGEMDLGGGGDDSGGDSAGNGPRLNGKTKLWAKGLGLNTEELKNVDLEGDPKIETILDPAYKD